MSDPQENAAAKIDSQVLWEKYEDIAMHFNDLLMRLRSQSLAGIAAMSTLVGIFTKESPTDAKMDWLAATAIFIAMALFWIAIFCLDLLYYNRLLIGAVSAITDLEKQLASETATPIKIKMSTLIEHEFRLPGFPRPNSSFGGVLLFYLIVLVAIICGALFSLHMYGNSH